MSPPEVETGGVHEGQQELQAAKVRQGEVGPLLNGVADLVIKDMEQAEELNGLSWSFLVRCALGNLRPLRPVVNSGAMKISP